MKRLMIALALLVLIIGLCAGTYFYVSHASDVLEQGVAAAQAQVRRDEIDAAHAGMNGNYTAWRQRYHMLSALVRHNEIDDTERLYRRTLQALENGDKDEALIQLAELQALLLHLPEMEKPGLSNLL